MTLRRDTLWSGLEGEPRSPVRGFPWHYRKLVTSRSACWDAAGKCFERGGSRACSSAGSVPWRGDWAWEIFRVRAVPFFAEAAQELRLLGKSVESEG